MAGNPRWAASGAGKVFQTLGQCRGELRRRDLVVGATEDAEERCAQAAVTLWAVNLDEKAQHLKQPEGKSLPVLNLAMNSRLEKLIGPVAWEEDEKKAQANLEEAMASQDPERQARASHELAACRAQKGDLDLELLSSALTLSEGDHAGEAVTCNSLANLYILRGQAKDALRCVKQGLRALRAMGGNQLYEVPLLQTMMAACWSRRDGDEALRCAREVALLLGDVRNEVLSGLAQGCVALALLANGEEGPAEKGIEAAVRAVSDVDGQILLLAAQQEVSYAIGKPQSAMQAAQELLAKERQRGVKEGVARALLLVSSSSDAAAAEEAKKQFAALNDKPGVALATLCVARSNLDSGAQEVLKTLEGPPVVMAFGQVVKALAQIRQEDAKGGERSAREALSLFQDENHRVGQALAELCVRKAQQAAQKPTECKMVIDDDRVAHVEISGICTPKSMDTVLNALHQARCKEGVKAVVLLLQGLKGPVSPAYGTSPGAAAPPAQAMASGGFLLGLRTLNLPCVVACLGKVAGPAWGLVLAADYRIASATSSFVLPIWGPPECLGNLVGHTAAVQLCYNQGPVSALTMLEHGVIHQCQRGDGETKAAAAEVARRIASTPSMACHQSSNMLSPAVESYATTVARGGVRA